MLRGASYRLPADGLPRCDTIMQRGTLLPLGHALGDDHVDYISECVASSLRNGGH